MVKDSAGKGDKVKVDYEGRFESGEVFDSSTHGDHSHPLEFEVGAGQMIPGFDNALIGMQKGQEKEIKIDVKDAYGDHREDLIKEISVNAFPSDKKFKEGMTILMGTPDGKQFPAKIVKMDKDKIKLDLNHPLAGKKLTFKIKLLEIG